MLKLKLADSSTSIGHLINYLATDVYQIEYGILFLPYLVTGFVQAAIVILILCLRGYYDHLIGFSVIIIGFLLKTWFIRIYSDFK